MLSNTAHKKKGRFRKEGEKMEEFDKLLSLKNE